jgi:hypothetical protein
MTPTATELLPPGDLENPDNPEALALAYTEARETYAYFVGWTDALATKAIGLFTAASLIVSLVPAVTDLHPIGWHRWLWLGSLFAWAVSAIACALVLWPRDLFTFNPRTVLDPKWRTLPAIWYHRFRLDNIASAYEQNEQVLRAKTQWLLFELAATGAEVLLLAMLLFLSAPR